MYLFLLHVGAPQFLRNFKNKSTYGMSIHMVIMWTLGDMFKTGYFIVRKAPSQFWICGTLQASILYILRYKYMRWEYYLCSIFMEFQVSLDIAILSQVWFYRKNSKPRDLRRGD